MPRQRATSVQALVDAAAKAFERNGYVDTTIGDIAAEAGVSKPTVYQYVKSKQWLLETIVEQLIYPLRDGVLDIVNSDATPRSKLENYVRFQVNSAIRYRTFYAVLTTDQHQLSPRALRNYVRWARQVDRAVVSLFQQCVDDGVVRADLDVRTVVNLVNTMLTSIGRWYRPSGRLGAERLVNEVIGLLSGYILSDGEPNAARAELTRTGA